MTLKELADKANALVTEVGEEKAATLPVAIPTGHNGTVVEPDTTYPGYSFIDGCVHVAESGPHGLPECVVIQ